MDSTQLSWIANFIWGIADDVLRDLYVRGKYRDVILPMTVLRLRANCCPVSSRHPDGAPELLQLLSPADLQGGAGNSPIFHR